MMSKNLEPLGWNVMTVNGKKLLRLQSLKSSWNYENLYQLLIKRGNRNNTGNRWRLQALMCIYQ